MNADEHVDSTDADSTDDSVLGWRIAGVGMLLVGIPYVVSLPGLLDGLLSFVGLGCLVWGWYRIFKTRRRG